MPAGDGLRLAVTTLTVLPLRGPARPDRAAGRAAMLLAPLVGLTLGLAVAAVVLGVRVAVVRDEGGLILPAAAGVAALALATRGLHLDGLADTVDGLASYRPPEQARAVMRDGGVGPLGVAAVVLTLLLQVAALQAAVTAHHGTVAVLVGVVSGRLALTVACRRGVPVAPGSRLGFAVVGTVPPAAAAAVVALTVAGCALAGALDYHTGDPRFEVAQSVAAPLAALAVTALLRRHAVRRLGGVGGDVLGAHVELGTLVALLVMSVASNPLRS